MNNPAKPPDSVTLIVIIDSEERKIRIEAEMLDNAASLIQKMDHDMNHGWQLGRDFIETPNTLQRCQIAADRLLTALHTDNEASTLLMSAYILCRLPNACTVNISVTGEAAETQFFDEHNCAIR